MKKLSTSIVLTFNIWLALCPLAMAQPPANSATPTLTLSVTNNTPDTVSADNVFATGKTIAFPSTIPSNGTQTYELMPSAGKLRGYINFYVKNQSETRLDFADNVIQVKEYLGQAKPIILVLSGSNCSATTCTWDGTYSIAISASILYKTQ